MTFSVVIDGYVYTRGLVFYYPSEDNTTGATVGGDASRISSQRLAIDDDIANVRTGPVIEAYDPEQGAFIQGWV